MNYSLLCLLGALSMALAIEPECGTTPIVPNVGSDVVDGSRIVNGQEAKPYSWPWQVVLCIKSGSTPNGCQINCGGSVINKEWILTAGHCEATTNTSQYKIKLGVFNIVDENEQGIVQVNVQRAVRHPMYNSPRQLGHDITLLKLATPIVYSDRIRPVCLATPADEAALKEGDAMINTGWGRLTGNGALPPKLQQVSIPYLDRPTCQKFDQFNLYDETKICAGGTAANQGACNGDSGGPLVRKVGDKWVQFGVTSYKTDINACVAKDRPNGYGRISTFCEFIKQTTGDDLCGH